MSSQSTTAASSSSPADITTKSGNVAVSVDHPLLEKTDPASIRVFLQRYDQYCRTVVARAKQLTSSSSLDDASTPTTTEAISPVELKYCVSAEHFTSCIMLGFMEGVTSFATLTNTQLRKYLDKQAEESKEAVTLEGLDDIISKELVMNMANKNARSRMEGLFISYHTILARQGLSWIIKDNQKLAVAHVLSAIRPQVLKERLEADLSFSQHALKKDFNKFLKHAVRLSEAFQLVDVGPRRKPKKNPRNRSGNPDHLQTEPSKDSDSTTPLCLFEPCRKKGIRHFLRHCKACPPEEKKRIREDLAAKKAASGPASNTRSKTANQNLPDQTSNNKHPPTARRVAHLDSSPSCTIVLHDEDTSIQCQGRCDDGSDESLISPRIAEAATLQGIGKLRSIKPIVVQVALKEKDKAQTFSFSRQWTVPRLTLQLSAGPLALLNVQLLVADDDLADEDILIGRPVLAHLGVDSRSILEQRRATLDETDCSHLQRHIGAKSKIGRLLIARLKRTRGSDANDEYDSSSKSSKTTPRPSSSYFANRSEPDPFPNPHLLDLPDKDHKANIELALENLLEDALTRGFPKSRFDDLRNMVLKRKNVFRLTFTNEPGANIPPLKLHLKPDAKPVLVKLRKYNESQRAFLRKLVRKLIDANLIYSNPTSRWACAPHLVPKQGPDEWRFTTDLRPINCQTYPQAFPLPIIEMEVDKASGACHFSEFDMTHGYWQLMLHQSSQECQSFVTPDGIYTPTRVLHGNLNANSHLHAAFMEHMDDELKLKLLLWVDDMVVAAKTIDELLKYTAMLLDLCIKLNFKLNPEKCRLYNTSVKWCGRHISRDGVKFCPRNIEGLEAMEEPTTAIQLLHFTSALQWLRTSIPSFSTLIQPLLDALERAYQLCNSRTKRALRKITLDQINWSQTEATAFAECKAALIDRVRLAHRNHDHRLSFYVDASDTHWAGIATQVPRQDAHLDHSERRHEPLAFLSGRFNDTQLRWSTNEKEAYSIMATLDRMHWLASCPEGFDLFTDHNNLIFIFDPRSIVPDLTLAAVRKVLRWAVKISTYNYECVHISGLKNEWADLMTRWSSQTPTIRRLISIPPLPSAEADEFEWPTAASIAASQKQHTPPHGLVNKEGLLHTTDGKIWIPDEDGDLQLRLCIIGHTTAAGHRGTNTTIAAIGERFHWTSLKDDVSLFVSSCIHCLSTAGGERTPRPFGPSTFGTHPNDLLQFDYIDMGKSTTGDKYILMLRDDHSGYAWFYPTVSTSAEQAASAIVDWCAAFGPPNSMMSDGPTHFRNETIRMLTKSLRAKHHFTTPYCPWSNGGIERLGKELLKTARALISELKLRTHSWPDVIPIIQSAVNLSPSPQRKNIPPLTAFSGLKPRQPINTFIRSDTAQVITVEQATMERLKNMTELINTMDNLHPVVQTSLQNNRERLRQHMSKGKMPNFEEGDFVLVARDNFHKGEKLCLRWRGPRRVIKAVNDWLYQIEDLRNGAIETAHASRLKFYSDSAFDSTAIMSHVMHSETGMPVARLMKFVECPDGIKVQVRWKGLSPLEDTLEPLQNVYEDVPRMLHKLMERSSTSQQLRDKVRETLGL